MSESVILLTKNERFERFAQNDLAKKSKVAQMALNLNFSLAPELSLICKIFSLIKEELLKQTKLKI